MKEALTGAPTGKRGGELSVSPGGRGGRCKGPEARASAGLWRKSEVFPPVGREGIAVGILAVIHNADVACLRAYRTELILVIVLFGRERLGTAFQGDGRTAATTDVQGVDSVSPQTLK